jgi:hypothetical protein
LAKSPNCASQTTSSFGAAVAKPYSKASTASSDSTESKHMEAALVLLDVLQRPVGALVPLLAVLVVQAAWRWKKVPRPTSSPETRML